MARMGAWRSGLLTVVVSGGVGLCTSAGGQTSEAGPVVSHLGIANADGTAVAPVSVDGEGRPMVQRILGQSFFLVFEGRPGENGERVAARTFEYDALDPTVLPDLQVLVSRPLGDGSTAVCDSIGTDAGGVPATASLAFDPVQAVADAVNDLGCRFDDGKGGNFGRDPQEACTMSSEGFGFGFVNAESTIQYCAFVSPAFAFGAGDTVLAVRLRDVSGTVGPPSQMVLRVLGPPPTPTRLPSCAGDCDRDGRVSVDELIQSVAVALSAAPLEGCEAADVDGDGAVAIDELTAAVRAAMAGCGQQF
jgi:hypothetical protein